jgi:hypothetical protein
MTTITASQQFQRAVRGLPFTAQYTFGLDGDSLPDSAPSVSISDAEGNVIASGATTWSSPTASVALSGSDIPERDLLTATWSFTVNSVAEEVASTVDVCDERLFTVSDWNQFTDDAIATADATTLETARREAEDFLEEACGRAFTGRYRQEEHYVPTGRTGFRTDPWSAGYLGAGRRRGTGRLTLRRAYALALRGVTRAWVDPQAGTSGTHALNLNYLALDNFTSTIHSHYDPTDTYSGLWGNLTVAYEHGRRVADVGRICLILARYRVINGPLERRAVSMQVEGGGSIQLLTPGMAASVTGIPEVDTFIRRFGARSTGFVG